MEFYEDVIILENSSSKMEFFSSEVIPWENPEEMTKPWVANKHFIPTVMVYSLCLILGSAGNALVMWAMQCGRSKTVTGMFLVSLAVADVLLIFSAPMDVASNFFKSNKGGSVSCKMVGYGRELSAFATVFNLMAITVERYIVIVKPMRARQYVTMKNCKITLVVVWTLAIIMAVPSIFTWEVQPFYWGKFDEHGNLVRESVVRVLVCEETIAEGGHIIFYNLVLLFILPLALQSVCFTRMVYVLWSSTTDTYLTTHTGNALKKPSSGDIHLLTPTPEPDPDGSCVGELLAHDVTESQDNQASGNLSSFHPSDNATVIPDSDGAVPLCRLSRRSRAESLAYTECPTTLLKRPSRRQRALNIILSWKRRHERHNTSPSNTLVNNQVAQHNNKNSELKAGRRQVIKMLIVVTLAFMVCWGPLVIFEVLRYHNMMPFQDSTYNARLVVTLLPYCHCCLNPVIYAYMSKNFRTALRKACMICPNQKSHLSKAKAEHVKVISSNLSSPPSPRPPKRSGQRLSI